MKVVVGDRKLVPERAAQFAREIQVLAKPPLGERNQAIESSESSAGDHTLTANECSRTVQFAEQRVRGAWHIVFVSMTPGTIIFSGASFIAERTAAPEGALTTARRYFGQR